MKYRVIGWTYCGDPKFRAHRPITASVDNVIVKDIREHGYCFGGDRHEDYCPVLNDGTYVEYSSRSWGGVMAKAHDVKNDNGYAYMNFYMDEFIKPEFKKLPEKRYIDDDDIVPIESLVETFEMRLDDDMFELVKAGSKTIETRLFDDKRKLVDIGDFIEFVKRSDGSQRIRRRVKDYDVSSTFLERFGKIDFNGKEPLMTLKYTPKSLGFDDNMSLEEIVKTMYKYYDKNDEKKYGVVTFMLEEPKHTCRTQLSVWTNAYCFRNRAEYSERAYTNGEDPSSIDKMEDDFEISQQKENDVISLIGKDNIDDVEILSGRVVEIGRNDKYDLDVNVMIRKTLKNLFGKEEGLRAIINKYWLCITLDIVALEVKDTKQPKQKFDLDDDIKEFLDKSGVELNLQVFEG